MGDQTLPRVRAADEERERGAERARRVVEGAGQGQLLVVEAERVDFDRTPAEEDDRAARPDERERVVPGLRRADRLDHDVGAASVAGRGAEERGEAPPLGPAADRDHVRSGVAGAGAEHEPDRPQPDHGHRLAALDARPRHAVEAACQRLGQRCDLGCQPWRHPQEVPLGNSRGDQEELGVGPVQERLQVLAQLLLAAPAGRTRAARCGVRSDDAPSRGVDSAKLVPEQARRLGQEQRMAASKRLRVRAVGERDLDPDDDITRPGHGVGNLLEPEVAGRVKPQRAHRSIVRARGGAADLG